MEKINLTIGRFQPFTQGHLNMVKEGKNKCIIYQIKPAEIPDNLKAFKISGKVVKSESILNVIKYIDGEDIKLTEQEKELLKKPFTNELIKKELDIVKANNKEIFDIKYVKNMFEALIEFNTFIYNNSDKYEPEFLMCGDDRSEEYAKTIDKYDELEDHVGSGNKIPNLLKGKLKVNTGNGRTEGISGTEVRKSILSNNRSKFNNIMPRGTDKLFDDFVNAFNDFKEKLMSIKEHSKKYISLKNYLFESL